MSEQVGGKGVRCLETGHYGDLIKYISVGSEFQSDILLVMTLYFYVLLLFPTWYLREVIDILQAL